MPDEWRPPSLPDVKKDFNDAAKPPVKQELPPSDKGIATKEELDKRIAMETRLREKMALQNAPVLKPRNDIARDVEKQTFQKKKDEFEANQEIKDEIKAKLEKKKKDELARQFNERAGPERRR